jgi:hypothetical protein
LLPHNGRVIPAFREYLAQVGSLDQMYVRFTAPEGYSVGDYEGEIDAWTEALRSAPEIARVDTGVPDQSRDFQWLADRRLLLLRDGMLDEALRRLEPDGLQRAVAQGCLALYATPWAARKLVSTSASLPAAIYRKTIAAGS